MGTGAVGVGMRLIRGIGALLLLALLAVGVPAALVLLGGLPLPNSWSPDAWLHALLRRDDGRILVGVITVIGWCAWLVFAASLVIELINLVAGARLRIRVPGLAGPQRLAAGLLLSVVAMLTLPTSAGFAQPVTHTGAPPAVSSHSRAAEVTRSDGHSAGPELTTSRTAVPSARLGAHPLTHVVERGDDLWGLAEHYYGQGRDWRKIASANPRLLTGGPDRLQPGWRLTIPDLDLITTGTDAHADVVTVTAGDTLTSIATRAYGAPDWQRLYEANRSQLDDPDEIEPGTQLRVPAAGDVESSRRPASETGRAGHVPGRPPSSPSVHHRAATPAPKPHEAPRPPDGDGRGSSEPAPAPLPKESAGSGSASSERANPRPGASTQASSAPLPAPAEHPEGTQPTSYQPGSMSEPAVWGVGAVGGLLAAALLSTLALRRRVQLQGRPVGRRIPQPPSATQAVETALGHQQQPLGLQTLDLAMRAVAASCHAAAAPLPPLLLAKVGPDAVELVLSEPAAVPPVGFEVSGATWRLNVAHASYLDSVPGVDRAARPYPGLVTVGRGEDGGHLLVDLEAAGLLAVRADNEEVAEAMLAALAVELAFSPWADELVLTLVGTFPALPEAVGRHSVSFTDEVDQLLSRLEHRAETQRVHQEHAVLGQHRVDPDLADPWSPEIVLMNQELTQQQRTRLESLLLSEPRVAVAAVVAGAVGEAPWVLEVGPADPGGGELAAVLRPLGLTLRPQHLPELARAAVVDLLSTTGAQHTDPAPWWWQPDEEARPTPSPPDNVTYLGKRFGGWGSTEDTTEESDIMQEDPEGAADDGPHHPILRLLGPVDLLGAQGTLPPRAAKQCLEYCGWLLEHPGTTAQAMATALIVAEGTRRSNMSRLRTWLGADDDGQPYLPDAYTGRILLHPSVSSDWQRLQILTASGVNRTSTAGLQAALGLVRGAPLADAAPGQWHWAEELRTDMISVVRDVGVELAARALADHDVQLARWAAARALAAAPGDELLMAARIRTEHRAGNAAETERLTLQLAAQARLLGVDLDDETVTLLQEVMEGRVRARMA